MVDRTLLVERTRLRTRLTELETSRSLEGWGYAGGSGWSHHGRRACRPSRTCVTTYVDAVSRLLPALAWSSEDSTRRRTLLACLHDAFANEDLAEIERIRAVAEDRPPADATSARLHLHVAWLAHRIEEIEGDHRAA